MNSEILNEKIHDLLFNKTSFKRREVICMRLGIGYDSWYSSEEIADFLNMACAEVESVYEDRCRFIAENIEKEGWFSHGLETHTDELIVHCKPIALRLTNDNIPGGFSKEAFVPLSSYWAQRHCRTTIIGENENSGELLVSVTNDTADQRATLMKIQKHGNSFDVSVAQNIVGSLRRRRADLGGQLAIISSFRSAENCQQYTSGQARLIDFHVQESSEEWLDANFNSNHAVWTFNPLA